ncbi:hypothetical protein AHAS_Ahas19G0360200 [Arachis hypogaea]
MMVCCTAAGELLQAAAYVELLRCCWPAVALLACYERDVYEFFSRTGKVMVLHMLSYVTLELLSSVREVRLIMDCNSRRSKGFGYIEFYDVMSVPMAIALSGQFLLGQPVMVKPSEAEKNLVRLSLSSCLLMKVGTAKVLDLCRGAHILCGSFDCIELRSAGRETGARNAWSLNGQSEIGGRTIKVSAITDQSGMQEVGGNIGDLDDD